VIIDCHAAHRCDDVLALADELGIRLHFIPQCLTGMLQPLDRAVFGALKAEYRAIYRPEMSPRQDKSTTKVDFAAYLPPRKSASEDAICRAWECSPAEPLCWRRSWRRP
jgi:hypothetical protein